MDGRGAEPGEGGPMLAHRIALVLGKAVSRILPIELAHEGVAGGLEKMPVPFIRFARTHDKPVRNEESQYQR